jgi:iron-sulfur cluster repair protein YtfE (RIC family)
VQVKIIINSTVTSSDPVRRFEHSHGQLTKMALDVRRLVHAEPSKGQPAARIRRQIAVRVELLRDELLRHFADEEEALFPFVRQHTPTLVEKVDALQRAHDAICGALLRLAHLVEHAAGSFEARRPELVALYQRFEDAYTEHSQNEAALFEALERILDERQRVQLGEILRGL